MGGAISNFAKEDWNSIKDLEGGLVGGVTSTLKGLTGGGFDYGESGRDFENYGVDVADAFGAGVAKVKAPVDQIAVARNNYNNSIDPTKRWNSQNWESMSRSRSIAAGSITGNTSVSNSDISKISNPITKMAYSGASGSTRSALNTVGHITDMSNNGVS